MSLYLALFLFLISTAFCILDPEVYNELKEKAPFKILDYETIVDIFKDYNPGDPEIRRRNRMEDKKYFLEKFREQSESEPFMALEKEKIMLPKEFDWRKERPECFKPPQAQRNCGACFIFSAVSAFEERVCIKTKGKLQLDLSQQEILSCGKNHDKCEGGSISSAWEHLEKSGTCSYRCKPYVSYDGDVPRCIKACDNPKNDYVKYQALKNSMVVIMNDIEKIKEEVYKNGPVTTSMETFEDIDAFESGFYFHTVGKPTDLHAIAIVGWGHEDSVNKDYWILRNSWGPRWGDGGYFKVMTGLYGLEECAVASQPDI